MKDKRGGVYVPIYLDWLEVTQDLTAEEKGLLIDAVVSYAAGEDQSEALAGGARIAFRFLKGQVDRNRELSATRSKAARGGATSDNPEQNGTNGSKTEQNGTNAPKEKENKKENNNKKENELMFARFWAAYPRHEAKATARKAFDKISPDEGLLATMLTAIERHKRTAQWQENGGQYIPHPSTWLNQRRWEDEPVQATPRAAVVAQQYGQRDYGGEQQEAMERMLRGAGA